jgi:hypothetical protein
MVMTADQYAMAHMVRYPEDKPIDVARAYNRYKKIAEETGQEQFPEQQQAKEAE